MSPASPQFDDAAGTAVSPAAGAAPLQDTHGPAIPETPARRRSAGRNLPVAIATGLALGGLVAGALFFSPVAFVLLLLLLVGLALRELLEVLRARATSPAAPVVWVASVLLVVGAYFKGQAALSFGMLVALFGSFAWYLGSKRRAEVTRNLAATVFACAYVPFCAAYLAIVVTMHHHAGAIMGYAVVTVAYDIGAYAVGSLIGRHKMAPSVSPNKSWEGAAGASVLSLAAGGLALPLWAPWGVASGLTLGLVACVVAPVGDLVESMLKRDLAVKDMGTLLPGHGGMLDRIDALLLMAPALYYVVVAFSLGRP